MLRSTLHWRPMLNGYSGHYPESYVKLLYTMRDFPYTPALVDLRRRGATVLILHDVDRLASFIRCKQSSDSCATRASGHCGGHGCRAARDLRPPASGRGQFSVFRDRATASATMTMPQASSARHLRPQHVPADALQEDPAHDDDEVAQRNQVRERLDDRRHVLDREDEARQVDHRRQHEERRRHRRLLLRARDRRDEEPEPERRQQVDAARQPNSSSGLPSSGILNHADGDRSHQDDVDDADQRHTAAACRR